MKTTAKTPDVFGSLLAALRAVYDAEIARLAEVYRPRILAGEFSGRHCDDLAFLRLEQEIETTHPWARDVIAARAVLAVSTWAHDERSSVMPGSGASVELAGKALASEAGECIARDVLAVAAERGWVKRFREGDSRPYALRVA